MEYSSLRLYRRDNAKPAFAYEAFITLEKPIRFGRRMTRPFLSLSDRNYTFARHSCQDNFVVLFNIFTGMAAQALGQGVPRLLHPSMICSQNLKE